MMEVVGFDLGTSSVKAVAAEKRIRFPSAIGDHIPRQAMIAARSKPVLVYGDRHFAFGELALAERLNVRFAIQRGRIIDAEVASMLIDAALALLLEGDEDVKLVLGVPLEATEESIAKFRERLLGERRIRLDDENVPSHLPSHSKRIVANIAAVQVFPQALGALFAQDAVVKATSLNRPLGRDDVELKGSLTGFIIDIGFGTTNFAAVSADTGVNYAASKTANVGVWDVAHELRSRLGLPLDEMELNNALLDDEVWLAGRSYAIAKPRAEICNALASRIYTDALALLAQLPPNSPIARRILITGGGALLIGQRLLALFQRSGYSASIVRDPIFANAVGFFIAGHLA